MPYEDHKIVQIIRDFDNELAGLPRDELYDQHAMKMAGYTPQSRTNILYEMDRLIEADETTSLRQKSQMISLRRHMTEVHEKLLRAKR